MAHKMNRVATPGYLRYPHIHGDLLTFVTEDDVWLAPAEGGRAWRLTSDGGQAGNPRFSPDGATIAWTSWRDGGIPEVYTAEIDGGTGGPATRRTYWGDLRTRTTGWTDAGEVLATSAVDQPSSQRTNAYAVPLDAPPRRLPFGQVNDLALTTTGDRPADRAARRPGLLEALPRRHRRPPLGRHRRRPALHARPQRAGRPARQPDDHRRPPGLPLRSRGHRQHLLGRARRRRPAQAHRPRRVLRPQPRHRRHPRGLPPGGRHLAARQPRRRRPAAQAGHPARHPAHRPRAQADHRRRPPGRPRLRPDRAGERGDRARHRALAHARRRPGPGAAGRPGRARPAAAGARQDRLGRLGHRRQRVPTPSKRPRSTPSRPRDDQDHRRRRSRQHPRPGVVAGRDQARGHRRRRPAAGHRRRVGRGRPSSPATTTGRSRTSPGRPTRPGWPGRSRGRSRSPGSGWRGSRTARSRT